MSTPCVSGSQVNSVKARQFKQRRFERRTSTESGLFVLLSCDFEQALRQNVFFTVKTLGNINLVVSNKKRKKLTSWWRSSLQNIPALNLINGAYSIWFFFIKCWQNFLELNSKGLYQSSGKEKESCPVFPSATKREIRHSRCSRATTAKKCTKSLMRVQSCYFANITLLLFCRSPCHCRRCCLSFLIRAWLCERCS